MENRMPFYAMMLATAVALIWGVNFAASKLVLLHLPPFLVIFIRYVLVTLLLLPFARKVELSHKQIFYLAMLMIVLHFNLVFTALWMGLPITTTVVAIQLGAPASCVIGAMFLNDRLGAWRTGGMAVAFTGILIVMGTPEVAANELAFLLAVLGAVAWAASNVYMKKINKTAIMPLLFWTGLYSLPGTLLFSLLLENGHMEAIENAPMSAWVGLVYTVLMSTIVGYGLWYWLITRFSITQVTPFALLVPIGGLSSGMLFFDEGLTWRSGIGAAITIVGVAIITIRKPSLAKAARG